MVLCAWADPSRPHALGGGFLAHLLVLTAGGPGSGQKLGGGQGGDAPRRREEPRSQISCGSTHRSSLEESDSQRQKGEKRVPGAGRRRMGASVYQVERFSFTRCRIMRMV